MSLMFFAAAMAALLGVVTLARGLGTGTSGSFNRSQSRSSDDPVSSFDQLYHNANIPLAPVTLITLYQDNVSLFDGWSTFGMVEIMPSSQALDVLPCPSGP